MNLQTDAIRYSRKWYNPLFFILNELIKIPTIRRVLVYGGKRSSKTISIAQLLSKECVGRRANTIAFRKENNIIPTTLKKSFNLGISSQFLQLAFISQDRKYVCRRGAEIVLKGLDEEEKAKGIESYKYLYLDELNQFDYDEFLQFDMSLSGMEGQKIFGSWNPVSETSWIKTKLIDVDEWKDMEQYSLPNPDSFIRINAAGDTVLIRTNYEDNYWIVGSPSGDYGFVDNNIISLYNSLKHKDPEAYRVNVLGEWGVIKPGDPYVYAFDKEKHSGDTVLNRGREVYLSFDFNRNPITCGVYQHDRVGEIRGIESIQLANSDIYKLCDRINETYYGCMFMVTGDATGRASTALVQDGINYYTVIKQKLNLSGGQLRVPNINPVVTENRMLVNAAFHTGNIVLDKNKCAPLIFDCQYVGVKDDGDIDKGTRADPKKRADHLDNFRYYLNTFHKHLLKTP